MKKSVSREVSAHTVAQVLRMKRVSLISNRGIAKELGIGRSTVDRIVRGLHISLRDGRESPLKRCACGAAVVGRCVTCDARRFRDLVARLLNAWPGDDPLSLAARGSVAITTWILSLESLRQLEIPDEVAEDLGRAGVSMALLRQLLPAAHEVAQIVSGETNEFDKRLSRSHR